MKKYLVKQNIFATPPPPENAFTIAFKTAYLGYRNVFMFYNTCK